MKIDFKTITENYINDKQKVFDDLREAALNIVDFKSVPFNNTELPVSVLSNYNNKNVLYFIKILNNQKGLSTQICEEIERLKTDTKFANKLPLVNWNNAPLDNGILYVGKSSGGFSARLKQHLGYSSASTYALHFNKWNESLLLSDVQLELFYTVVDISSYQWQNREEIGFLEELETILHLCLKPILGRTGH